MSGLIIPNRYVEVNGSLIFLAGPIMGAPNWQDEAIDFILTRKPRMTVVSPRRGIRQSIARHILPSEENYFPRQRAWERYYLDLASKTGAIMFWLPRESEHRCEKVYGAMTRLELGQWMTNYRNNNSVRVCFGSDGKFPELDTVKYDLSLDTPDKDIKTTLEETCLEAIKLASN